MSSVHIKLIGNDASNGSEKEPENVDVSVEECIGTDKKDSCIYAQLFRLMSMGEGQAYIQSRLDSTWRVQLESAEVLSLGQIYHQRKIVPCKSSRRSLSNGPSQRRREGKARPR